MKTNRFFANPDKLGQIARKIAAQVVVFMLLFAVVSCNSELDLGVPTGTATGIIIGSYSHSGWLQFLVQVDSSFPIGETLKWSQNEICTKLYRDGVFLNVIGIQMLKGVNANVKQVISFSYREFRHGNDNDISLFTLPLGPGFGNALCAPPDVPLYVVTDFQILN